MVMSTDLALTDAYVADQIREARSREFVKLVCALKQPEDDGPRSLSDELSLMHACERVLDRWPRTVSADLLRKRTQWTYEKAIVNPGTVAEPSWAGPLATIRPLIDAFVALSRASSLIGKLLPLANRVPFQTSIPVQTGGGTYRWVGEGAPKPTGNMQLQSATLGITKASGIIVISNELAKLTNGASERVVRNDLINGSGQFLDQQFSDPTVVAVTNVSPASITNAGIQVGSSGTSASNAATDVKKVIDVFLQNNPNAANLVLLMSPSVATAIAVATTSQTLGPTGGTVFGIPVVTGSIGSRIIALDPSQLLIADEGAADVTMSTSGTVEFDTAPSSPITAGSTIVSLWQNNLTGFRVDRFVNWKMSKNSAVVYSTVAYV